MSDTMESLRRQRASAGDLQSVVRTMKALAAAGIGQYEQSVKSLADYYRTIELGLGACFRAMHSSSHINAGEIPHDTGAVGAIVFGSDQGLVGQFNDTIADHAMKTITELGGTAHVWAVGERVHARLVDAGITPVGLFAVPNSIKGIASLVGKIQVESEDHRAHGEYARVYVFHNRPQPGALYEPIAQRLLPLDGKWQQDLTRIPWPSHLIPEILIGSPGTIRALIREYLFISLFRACAESLASENSSRLAAMQRADKNIDEMIESVQGQFQRLRQSTIDEELFDVISGFEALGGERRDS
jgi:F-type H+-transporting ATPase subunit gamma